MRSVLALAVLILALVLALDVEQWTELSASQREAVEQRYSEHAFHIYSCGWRMEPLLLGAKREFRTIYVDDAKYVAAGRRSGLRVLSLSGNGTEPEIGNYDLANDPGSVLRLVARLSALPLNTVVAMAAYKSIGPRRDASEEHWANLDRLFATIGSKTQPHKSRYCSFAYLCIRRPAGFVPVAEAFSTTRGVHLPFLLSADRSAYDGREVHAFIDGRILYPLSLEDAEGEGLKVLPMHAIQKRKHPAIGMHAALDKPARVAWDLRKDGKPLSSDKPLIFTMRLALNHSRSPNSIGARFRLHINGRSVGDFTLLYRASDMGRWHAWEVILDPGLREIENLEILVENLGKEGARPAHVYVGRPIMSVGSTTSI